MPVIRLNPNVDRTTLIHADWTHTAGFTTFYECISPDVLDNERVQHNGNYTGTKAEISFADISTTWNAYAVFSEVRCRAVRLSILASLLNPLSLLVASIGIEYPPPGAAATKVEATTIQHPGTVEVGASPGPDFLETISWLQGAWANFKDDGTEWSQSDLDAICLILEGWQASRVYSALAEVYLDLQALVAFGDPHYSGQQMGRFKKFTWRFNNRGEGFSQKRYYIKIYKDADFYFGINLDTDTNQFLSAVETSTNNWHDFSYKVGPRRIASMPPGTYWFAIKVARDFDGEDWWSPWINVKFEVPDLGVFTFTNPPATETTSTRPLVEWTSSVADRRWDYNEVRVYQTPLASDFDVDATDIDPYYQHVEGGDGLGTFINTSMENGTYIIYMRMYDQATGEWTDWASYEWTQNVAQPSAPGTTIVGHSDTSSVDVIATFYSGKLADNTVALQVHRDSVGYDEEVVRIIPNDVYDSHLNPLDGGLRPVGIRVPGENFAGIRLTNSTAYQPTTGLDVEVGVLKPDGWGTITGVRSLASRWDDLGGDFRSWDFQLLTDKKLYIRWSTAGTSGTVLSATSTAALPTFLAISEVYLRAQISFANPYTVKFWYSTNQGSTWTQLGADVVGGAATSIFDTTNHLYIDLGGNDGLLGNLGVLVFSHFKLRSSVGGTVVAGAEFTGPNTITANPTAMTAVGTNTSYFYQIFGSDYEPVHNVSMTYRARGVVYNTTNDELRYGAYSSQSVTLTNQTVWLKDLSDPTRNARFKANMAWHNRDTNKNRSQHHPLGRDLPVVFKSDGRGESFDYSFTCIGSAEVDNLISILNGGGTLKLTTPKRSWYVEVSGAWSQSDHIFDVRDGEEDARIITVPFVEVRSPDVPSIA